MTHRRGAVLLAGIILALAVLMPAAGGAGHPFLDRLRQVFLRPGLEHPTGYYTFVDEAGNVILRTAVSVARGSLFIDPDDNHYRVVGVRGDIVHTVLEPAGEAALRPPSWSGLQLLEPRLWSPVLPESATAPGGRDLAVPLGAARHVLLIYHTHSDESYTPTDGRHAIPGNGGIYDVGETMASALSASGFTVVHDRTAHDPHDGGAYLRSRRTVRRNLQFGPTLLFDVHRDASPASEYLTTIDGQPASKILFVVGGTNPLLSANMSTVRRLRAAAEELHPGIIRGILVSPATFNQDLDPGCVLLEMGTYLIPKSYAQRTATLWANVVSAVLGAPTPPEAPGAAGDPTP
ncbi:MAG: stage II sporulation protein P [Bacillota bacterium]